MGSLEEVNSARTSLTRLGEIASSLFCQDTGRFPAWDRLLRSPATSERNEALARTIRSECHGRESQNYRRRAADVLLNGSTVTVDQLIAVVVCCEEHREAAAKRVLAMGETLNDTQRRQMQRWVPSLMGVEDTADASHMRMVRSVLMP